MTSHQGPVTTPLSLASIGLRESDIEKDSGGYPKSQDWEDLRAWPLGDGNLQIESIPFFANGLAVGDIIAATRSEEGILILDYLVKTDGHSTFRVSLHDETTAKKIQIARNACSSAGHLIEAFKAK